MQPKPPLKKNLGKPQSHLSAWRIWVKQARRTPCLFYDIILHMILKKLEISGFKSFANPVLFEFNSSISAIVGPNGSGKSNVAEAFRFVLGEQSKKNLRSKNAADLIWAGNKFRPKLNRARVSLHFDNSQKDFNLVFSEIKIERVLFSDGTNEYYINDSQVRLKDIQELLAQVGIGQSSHHIISQGQADRLLSANDKEKMLIIKEALGLNTYIYKINDTVKKLARSEENIKEVKISLRELKPQLKFLETQIEKQKRIDELKEELITAYASYIYLEDQKIRAEREELLNNLSKAKQAVSEAKEKLENFYNKKSTDAGLHHTSDTLDKLKNKIISTQKDINGKEKRISELEGKKAVLRKVLDGIHKKRSDSVSVSLTLLRRILDFLKGLTSKDEAANKKDAKELFTELKRFVNSAEKESGISLSETEKELKEIKKDINILHFDLAELKDRLSGLNEELQEKEEERKSRYAREQGRERRLLDLSERKNKAESKYKDLEKELMMLKNRENSLLGILQEANNSLGTPFVRYLRELKSSQRALEANYNLMQVERIKIALSELGSVDDGTIREYKHLSEKIQFLKRELEDLQISKEKTEQVIEELYNRLNKDIEKGVQKISAEFNNFFVMLFGGGRAGIERYTQENSLGEKVEAVKINIKIPGKRVSSMESLSGGERSLASIALIFAMSQISPPPFIILDETDAALDEANSKKYSDILIQLSQNSQLITITHNRQTMSVAEHIFGVTMGQDAVSQVLSINFEEAQTVAK